MKNKPDTCKFPNCRFHPQPNGYCVGHQQYAKFQPVKVPEPVSKKSDQRKEEEKLYKKIVQQMAAVSKKCEIRSPVCSKIMQGLHHMKKRGINYLNKKFLKRSCNACNKYVEEHPTWAKTHGHSISVHKKEESAIRQ